MIHIAKGKLNKEVTNYFNKSFEERVDSAINAYLSTNMTYIDEMIERCIFQKLDDTISKKIATEVERSIHRVLSDDSHLKKIVTTKIQQQGG